MNETISSISVSASSRVYHIDVREGTKGQPYLTITEEPVKGAHGDRKRQRVFVHAEHLAKFVEALAQMAQVINQQPKHNGKSKSN